MLDQLWYALEFGVLYLGGLTVLLTCLVFMVSAFILKLHRPR